MQKRIPVFSVLIFMMYVNILEAAEMQPSVDTTIKSDITLKEYPINKLAYKTDVRLLKDDPERYYGSWQWVNNNGDSFIIHIQPNKEEWDKGGKTVKADIICRYSIVKQGKKVEVDNDGLKETILYGFTVEKQLLLAPVDCKVEQLDQSCFFAFQFISDKGDLANLKRGSLLSFFAKAFHMESDHNSQKVPLDLMMKKTSESY